MTALQQAEMDALCKDTNATMQVVSALRGYRALVKEMSDMMDPSCLHYVADEVEKLEALW